MQTCGSRETESACTFRYMKNPRIQIFSLNSFCYYRVVIVTRSKFSSEKNFRNLVNEKQERFVLIVCLVTHYRYSLTSLKLSTCSEAQGVRNAQQTRTHGMTMARWLVKSLRRVFKHQSLIPVPAQGVLKSTQDGASCHVSSYKLIFMLAQHRSEFMLTEIIFKNPPQYQVHNTVYTNLGEEETVITEEIAP